jgi:enoyl-CoA hydratase/carnithine racemase
MPGYDAIRIDADEGDARVRLWTLDRPDSRNAMSRGLVDQCLDWLDRAAGDADIGAIVLCGAGRGFCAGSDLGGLAAMDAAGRSAFEADSGRLARAMIAHPRPIVAAVHGFAIGGGLTLAAACDMVVCAADAKWGLPEVPIGLFPAWGLEAVTLRVGRAAARRLSFGIDTLDGRQAAAIGLADAVAEDPLAEAIAIARRLAALPAMQAAAVKRYFAQARTGEAADDEANALFMAACATPEAAASFETYGRKART